MLRLLILSVIIPSLLARHIDREGTSGTSRKYEDDNENRGWQSAKTHLRLHVKPPRNLHAKEGDSEYLECQAGGTPTPVIHWLKNGKELTKEGWSKEQLESNSGGSDSKMDISSTTSRLYLDCLSAEDEAEYTCVAENAFHKTSTTTQVFVSSSEDKSCKSKKPFGRAPRILMWTKTMLEKQGQETRLACRADGYPTPTIEWLGTRKEPLSLEDITKYQILSNGDLIIRDLKWGDMGNYVCVAENIHGTARVEVFVYPALPEE